MMNDIRREVEVTVAPLLRNILEDAQKLFRQEWALAKVEVREDARRARDGIVGLIFGLAVGTVAFLFANLMIVYLLVAAYSLAVWQAYGLVALALAFVSLGVGIWSGRRLRAIRYFPDLPFNSMRENVEWMQRSA